MIFVTRFRTENGGIERCSLFAENEAQALDFCEKRKLGEFLTNDNLFPDEYIFRHTLCSEWIEKQNFAEALHAGCFLGFMASRLNLLQEGDLLSDHGFVHWLAHFVAAAQQKVDTSDTDGILRVVRKIESLIPGMCPVTEEDRLSEPQFVPTLFF